MSSLPRPPFTNIATLQRTIRTASGFLAMFCLGLSCLASDSLGDEPILPSLSSSTVPAEKRPNIVLILADDLGCGDVSAYHAADVQTPNIDRLAGEGLIGRAMRANATVCSPSRAALLTGLYPDRVGVPGVIRTNPSDSWGFLDPNARTLADELGDLGYHTGIVGKWHLGLQSPNLPTERGFDWFHGFLGDMMDSYTTHRRHGMNYMRQNLEEISPVGHATDLFTDWARDYLAGRANDPEQPFFLYLAYNAPHFPIEPPESWLQRVQTRRPDLPPARAKNVAFVEHLDHGIGQVLARLDELGMTENTVVIVTSDNGGSLPHAQSNYPFRDGKQSHYDGGLRVPFLVRWPARIAAQSTSDYPGLTFDLFPTLIELAGGQPAPELDALSLGPDLDGKTSKNERDLYFTRREGGPRYGGGAYEALIRGRWKLLRNSPFEPFELYDLSTDPKEQQNQAAARPKLVRELQTAVQAQIQIGGRTPWQPPSAQSATER
jgi:arylsulfatase A-like enzyme